MCPEPRRPVYLPLLQSGFVQRRTPFLLLLTLGLAGCSSAPDVYAPPVQRRPLTVPATDGSLGYFVAMSDPAANTYIVRDISDTTEGGGWRWTYRRPELRFFLATVEHMNFIMDFSFPERIFRETGPVTLAFFVNGQLLDKAKFEKGGEQHYRHAVPAAMLRAGAANFVAIEPDRVWTSKTDGAVLGFVLARAGFSE